MLHNRVRRIEVERISNIEKIYEKWRPVVGDEEIEGYRKAGMGQRVGFGETPALLVVDMTKIYVDPKYPMAHGALVKTAVKGVQQVLAACRRADLPIFFVRPKRTTFTEMGLQREKWGCLKDSSLQDPEANTWQAEICPKDEDIVFEKTKSSCFFETHFRSMLTYLKIDTLMITGISTSGCVRAAVMDAFFCNFRVIIPEQCCGDRSPRAHLNNLFDMDMKYGDVMNIEDVLSHL